MLLFTWNLGKNPAALELALQYLEREASGATVLACFQELPTPLPPSLDAAVLARRGLGATVPVLARRRAVFVHSASVTCAAARPLANDRMQIARWRLASGTEFSVAGTHAVDRRNHSQPEVRGAHAALTRRELDEAWGHGHPLVVLGDFNAWPDLLELEHRACFFGVTSSYEHRPANETFFGRTSPPLFRVEPARGAPPGTYFAEDISRWRHIDHIYVSQALREGAQAQPLTALVGKSLVTRNGRPSSARFSDHLPVQGYISLV